MLSEHYVLGAYFLWVMVGLICQGPEPRLIPHRPRRRKPCVHPLPDDRHRHEEGSCEDFGRETVISVLLLTVSKMERIVIQ